MIQNSVNVMLTPVGKGGITKLGIFLLVKCGYFLFILIIQLDKEETTQVTSSDTWGHWEAGALSGRKIFSSLSMN